MGIANGNILTIEGGTFSQPGLAAGNVVIGNSTPDATDKPVKPYTGSGQANNNTLNVNAGTFYGSIYGGNVEIVGYAATNAAVANGNTVNIITATEIHGAVSGGNVHIKGGTAQADNNTVTIIGGEFISQSNSDISGGYASSVGDDDLGVTGGNAQANGNRVVINSANITVNKEDTQYLSRSIYGGYATAGSGPSAVANNNSVTINGGVIQLLPENELGFSEAVIFAGYATNGETNTANNNTLTINGGTILSYNDSGVSGTTYIGGGYAGINGTANGNKVIISGGKIGATDQKISVAGGRAGKEASNNEVTIGSGVTVTGDVYGGKGENPSSVTNENTVIIQGTIVDGDVYGGSGTGIAKGNTVIIDGGTVNPSGSYSVVYGGRAGGTTAIAEGNRVTIINGGTVTGDVYGGDGVNGASVSNNTVVVAKGTVNGNVYGGYGYWSDDVGEGQPIPAKPKVFNNAVTVGGADGVATINGNVYINFSEEYYASLEGYKNVIDPSGTLNVYNVGNTINDSTTDPGTGGNLYAPGATVNFFVKESELDSATPMLAVSGNADIKAAKVIAHVHNVGEIASGREFNLLSGGTISDAGTAYVITDGLVNNNCVVDSSTGKINPILDHSKDTASENSKSPSETQIVGVALVNGVMDMTAGQGLNEAAKAVGASNDGGRSMVPFASVGGSDMRQHSGSYVDMNTWNVGIGFAKEVKNSRGKLMFGPIVEYGKGSYDSYLDNGTHGSGDSSFWGVGAMMKQENKDGLYYEGSLRVGRLKNDYKSQLSGGASYENSATFYALHAGIGKVVKLNEDDTMDYYGKLFYTRQGSSSATLSSGHIYDFDAINSFRTRLGFRYTHKVNKNQDVYAGLSWQHEFGSTANATFHSGPYSFSAAAPSVKGETGILELGMKVRPSNGKFESNFGFIGSFGKQRGTGFNAQFQWNF